MKGASFLLGIAHGDEHMYACNNAGKKHYFKYGAPLYEASIQGDWKSAKAILDKKPELVSVERAATTATSLDAEQGSGGSPKCQDTILGDKPAQTRFERLSKQSNDSPLPRVNTLGSDEGSMTLQELMVFCTTLSKKVESLETDLKETKQIYGAAYTRLIKKVKKLEKTVKSSQARRRERTVVSDDEDALEDPSKQGRKIVEIDQDPGISLVQHDAEIQGRYGHDMEFNFDFDAAKEVSTAKKDVSTAELVSTAGAAVTTASVAVSTISSTRNTGVSTADDTTMAETLVYIRKSTAKDKSKGKMDESKTVKTKTKLQQEQERLDFEAAMRLQAELEEEEKQRIAMRLQAEEREKYTKAKQANAYRAYQSEKEGSWEVYTAELRGYSLMRFKTLAVLELAARSSKRAIEEELDQESSKRQKIDESLELAEEPRDKEADKLSQEELQQMMIIVPEQGMNVEALQTKYPIIYWEIYTEGTRKYWKIIRVGNHTERSSIQQNQQMTKKERYGELKRLFKLDTKDELWKLQNHIHDLTWKLYDSCGMHHVSTEKGIDIYMLVEKEYPLSRGTLTLMLVAKLLVDQDNEMSRNY
ncbi:hypothetical protein Tco_0494445 [Tanacetum coccineum]